MILVKRFIDCVFFSWSFNLLPSLFLLLPPLYLPLSFILEMFHIILWYFAWIDIRLGQMSLSLSFSLFLHFASYPVFHCCIIQCHPSAPLRYVNRHPVNDEINFCYCWLHWFKVHPIRFCCLLRRWLCCNRCEYTRNFPLDSARLCVIALRKPDVRPIKCRRRRPQNRKGFIVFQVNWIFFIRFLLLLLLFYSIFFLMFVAFCFIGAGSAAGSGHNFRFIFTCIVQKNKKA